MHSVMLRRMFRSRVSAEACAILQRQRCTVGEKNQNEQNNDSFLKITHVYGDKLEKSVLREDRYDNIMTCFCVVVK